MARRSSTRNVVVAAASGTAAAAVWALAEPPLGRRLGHGYSDVRLLGRMVGGERYWRPAGAAIHLANGAAFGAAVALTGSTAPRRVIGLVAVETVVTWPLMFVADRVHPDRRNGSLPPLATSRSVIVHELLMHALFGVVLAGLLWLFGRGRRR